MVCMYDICLNLSLHLMTTELHSVCKSAPLTFTPPLHPAWKPQSLLCLKRHQANCLMERDQQVSNNDIKAKIASGSKRMVPDCLQWGSESSAGYLKPRHSPNTCNLLNVYCYFPHKYFIWAGPSIFAVTFEYLLLFFFNLSVLAMDSIFNPHTTHFTNI